MDTFIPSVSSVTRCNHLKKVVISPDEKHAYCTTCQPQTGTIHKWYPNYKPEILTFFASENIPYKRIPAHNPNCSRIFQDFAPIITSPTAEMEYILEQEERQKLMLHCNTHNEVKQVYWYINDRFVKAAAANEKVFFEPTRAGKYKISCTDDQGRNTNSYISVQFI